MSPVSSMVFSVLPTNFPFSYYAPPPRRISGLRFLKLILQKIRHTPVVGGGAGVGDVINSPPRGRGVGCWESGAWASLETECVGVGREGLEEEKECEEEGKGGAGGGAGGGS